MDPFYEDKIVGVKVKGLSDQAVTISGELFDVGARAALEAAGFLYPKATKAISELAGLWEPDPEVMITRMDALVSRVAELKQAAGIAEEVPSEPGSTERAPTGGVPESISTPAPAGDRNIFGRYSVTAIVFNGDAEDDITYFTTLVDLGQGKVQWIDEGAAPIVISHDETSHRLYYFGDGAMLDAAFTSSEGRVTGKAYMTVSLWGTR